MNGISEKANCVKQELATQLESRIGQTAMQRFIPYVQMYEYEGLLFSDPVAFAQAIDRTDLESILHQIKGGFASPEEINDRFETAPSKRVLQLFRGYQKVTHGSLASERIGLEKIRTECRLFDAWVSRLESLGS
jgi:hypothetical protein